MTKSGILFIQLFLISSVVFSQSVKEKIDQNDKKVAIYTQDGAEILDLAAPLEILSVAGFEVYTVGAVKEPIKAQRLLTIIPDYDLASAPDPDILLFVGGGGTAKKAKKGKLKRWIQDLSSKADMTMSICTGVFFLAEAGILDGKNATTFKGSLDYLEESFPKIQVERGPRVVQDGNVITTAGISAGIDGALHLVEQTLGLDVAQAIQGYIEYNCWDRDNIKKLND